MKTGNARTHLQLPGPETLPAKAVFLQTRVLPLNLNRSEAENRKRKTDKSKEEQDDEYHHSCSSTIIILKFIA